MTVSILVPFGGPPCPHRQANRDFVHNHYEQRHATWELLEAVIPAESPWSKGAALTDAWRRSTGDVLVVADADSFIDPGVLSRAVDLVRAGHPWVVPHTWVQRLQRRYTEEVRNAAPPRRGRNCRPTYRGVIGGGIVVLAAEAWEAVAGVDQRFEGWGGEDISFGWALETLVGPCVRLEGELWHLWHPHPAPKRRGSPASEALAGRYKDARGKPEQMRAIVEERRSQWASRTSTSTTSPS